MSEQRISSTKRLVLPTIVCGLVLLLGVGFNAWNKSRKDTVAIEHIYQSQVSLVRLSRGQDRKYDNLRDAALWGAAAGHYKEADSYANQVLLLAPQYKTAKSQWRYGMGLYDAHEALGRAALAQGDVTAAKHHLFESLRQVKDNSMFRVAGPKMGLAKELLESGDKSTFLQFLKECQKSWTSDTGQKTLRVWQADVQAGRTPNFGYKALR